MRDEGNHTRHNRITPFAKMKYARSFNLSVLSKPQNEPDNERKSERRRNERTADVCVLLAKSPITTLLFVFLRTSVRVCALVDTQNPYG